MASSYSSSSVASGQPQRKIKCIPKYCWCGMQACAMVSTTPQNPNAMFWSCRLNKCKFWQWFTTEALIYPSRSDQMVDNQNLEPNAVNFGADEMVKIKKRLRLIEGKLKYIIILLVCLCAIVFIKM